MDVLMLQHDIAWAAPDANEQRIDALLEGQPAVDLIVLPEMWPTGFMTEPTADGLHKADDALRWMKRTARERHAAVVGSMAVQTDEGCVNRLYFVRPDGETDVYDKRHLFTYGGEHRHYRCGTQRTIVEWRGVRFLLQVCYDLRFPVWSRNRGDYDVAIYVANWPDSRIRVWDILLQARAIENQCYVVGVNRVGTDPVCTYSGHSTAVDPYGRVAARCNDHEEGAAVVRLDMEMLAAFRQKFPVLNDADDFTIPYLRQS